MTCDPKGEMGADALKEFLTLFGNPDIYTQTLLEVLFEELYYDSYEEVEIDETALHLSGETRQDGNQDGLPSSGTENDSQNNGCETTKS